MPMTFSPLDKPIDSNKTNATSIQLGQAYNSFSDVPLAAFALESMAKRETDPKQIRNWQVCEDTEMLRKALSISASVSASYDAISVSGDVEGKTQFYNELNVTSQDVSIVVNARNSYHWELDASSKPIQLKKELVQLKEGEFLQKYGDSYVSTVEIGGEYTGVYIFHSSSQAEKTSLLASINANLSASSGLTSGTMHADFESKIEQVHAETRLGVIFKDTRVGYSQKVPSKTANVGLVDYLDLIQKTEPDMPQVLNYQVSGYENISNFPAEWFAGIRHNRDLLYQGDVVNQSLLEERSLLDTQLAEITRIQKLYAWYGIVPVDKGNISKYAEMLTKDIQTIDRLLKAIRLSPNTAVTYPDLSSAQLKPPELNISQVQVASWGGNGGSPFTDVQAEDARQGKRIASIQIRAGAIMDALICKYTTIDSKSTGAADVNTFHGTAGGNASLVYDLPEGHHAKKISGNYGFWRSEVPCCMQFLALEFEKGPAFSYAPTSFRGTAFAYELKPNEALVGFNGRSGGCIDQLQPVIAQFGPLWEDFPGSN